MEQILIFASYIIVALLGMGIVYIAPKKKPTYEEISDLEYKMRKEIEIKRSINYELTPMEVHDLIIQNQTKPIHSRCPTILVFLKNGHLAGARFGADTVSHDLGTNDRNRIGEGIDYTHIVICPTGTIMGNFNMHHKDMKLIYSHEHPYGKASHGDFSSMPISEMLELLKKYQPNK